jgi:hypothetical protein
MIDLPDAVAAMFAAWNATDEATIRSLAERALAAEVEFVDPHYVLRGLDAWIAMVLEFRAANPDAAPARASEIQAQHGRAVYAWAVTLADGMRLTGFDAIATDPATGRISRIDGFYAPFPVAR